LYLLTFPKRDDKINIRLFKVNPILENI